MADNYPVDIHVRDIADKLLERLAGAGFQRVELSSLAQPDIRLFTRMDTRDVPGAVGLLPGEAWRSDDDHVVCHNPEGTMAYVRQNPTAPRIPYALPFDIHFRTAAPYGYNPQQYLSLALPQRNLQLLLAALKSQSSSMSAIARMDGFNPILRLPNQLAEADEASPDALPIHLFHSTYISRTRDVKMGASDKEKAVEELSQAMGAVIIATHLFSRKQIAYYRAAADIDRIFSDSAMVW